MYLNSETLGRLKDSESGRDTTRVHSVLDTVVLFSTAREKMGKFLKTNVGKWNFPGPATTCLTVLQGQQVRLFTK